jgi:hypothetical protein
LIPTRATGDNLAAGGEMFVARKLKAIPEEKISRVASQQQGTPEH